MYPLDNNVSPLIDSRTNEPPCYLRSSSSIFFCYSRKREWHALPRGAGWVIKDVYDTVTSANDVSGCLQVQRSRSDNRFNFLWQCSWASHRGVYALILLTVIRAQDFSTTFSQRPPCTTGSEYILLPLSLMSRALLQFHTTSSLPVPGHGYRIPSGVRV